MPKKVQPKQALHLDGIHFPPGQIFSSRVLAERVFGLLLGPEYGELINTLGLAIKLGLTTRQLKSATTAYPTVGSDLGSIL